MNKKYAFVYLVMNGDKYIKGAIVSGYSIRKTEYPDSNFDIILMVTDSSYKKFKAVSKSMINFCSKLEYKKGKKIFDYIVSVPYIYNKTAPLKTSGQIKVYSEWMPVSFTKWNCLGLVDYKKVLFLDADTLILKNIEHLFKMKAPAGVFIRKHASPYIKPRKYKGGIYDGIPNEYKDLIKSGSGEYGKKIPANILMRAIKKGNFVVDGSLVLLSPSKEEYKKYVDIVITPKVFGKPSYSGQDENAITYFYASRGISFRHIPLNYLYSPWGVSERYFKFKKNEIYVYNFQNPVKPWEIKKGLYSDVDLWWKYYKKILSINNVEK